MRKKSQKKLKIIVADGLSHLHCRDDVIVKQLSIAPSPPRQFAVHLDGNLSATYSQQLLMDGHTRKQDF